MPFNRIGGFYVGNFSGLELQSMSIDDQNQELNDVLNSRLDQLNAAIAAHEKALKAMTIPREVVHCYETEDDYDPDGNPVAQFQYYIGMIKQQHAWRLCHGTQYSNDPNPYSGYSWKPLVDCSVPIRLGAAPHLCALREKVVEDKKKLIPALETTIEELATSLEPCKDKAKRK